MKAIFPTVVTGSYRREGPLVREFGSEALPSCCAFWPAAELQQYNDEHEVPIYAPGCFAFASDGGGEIHAVSEAGPVLRLPCIGTAPDVALPAATTWAEFAHAPFGVVTRSAMCGHSTTLALG